MLTKNQIQDYNKNGFIVIEELLNKDEIKKTRGIIDQFIEESKETNESDNIFDLEEDNSKENPRLSFRQLEYRRTNFESNNYNLWNTIKTFDKDKLVEYYKGQDYLKTRRKQLG